MDTYGDNLGEKFAAKSLKQFYESTVVDRITNKNYEGQLSAGGADRLNIKTFGKPTLTTYTGADLTKLKSVLENIFTNELIYIRDKSYFKDIVHNYSNALIFSNIDKNLAKEYEHLIPYEDNVELIYDYLRGLICRKRT